MPQMSHDAGIAGGGLGLAAYAGAINDILQGIILLLTIVLLAYRIRNARSRANEDKGE